MSYKQQRFYCEKCNGQCWKESDNFATQKADKQMFGVIPNDCVNSQIGFPKCPHSKYNK